MVYVTVCRRKKHSCCSWRNALYKCTFYLLTYLLTYFITQIILLEFSWVQLTVDARRDAWVHQSNVEQWGSACCYSPAGHGTISTHGRIRCTTRILGHVRSQGSFQVANQGCYMLLIFTRDSIYAVARICYRLSVCLSVRHTGGSVENAWS